jgi:hypothetical protein
VRERFPELRKLDLAEARVRLERALDVPDHTLGPPVDKDVHALRGLMFACAKLLPAGTGLPDEVEESVPDERESLLDDFLSSPEGRRWRDDEDAECVAVMAIACGIDYNHGGPRRWSRAVVESFMTGWLARKVPCEAEFFERMPEVLRDWVAYALRKNLSIERGEEVLFDEYRLTPPSSGSLPSATTMSWPRRGRRPRAVGVDGNVRRGGDVVKALALGARAGRAIIPIPPCTRPRSRSAHS